VSLIFVYYPEAIGLSDGGYDFDREGTVQSARESRESQGKMSGVGRGVGEEILMDTDSGSGGDVIMLDYDNTEFDYTKGDEDQDVRGTSISGGAGTRRYLTTEEQRIRHHHHIKHQIISLEHSEEKPFMSNLIENRLMHLDLKGANPKVSYLKDVR
jgi:hypothetical protein